MIDQPVYPWRKRGVNVLRRSVDVRRTRSHGPLEPIDHYPWMLTQDLTNNLFPYGGEVGHEPVFELQPENPELSAMVGDGFSRGSHNFGYRESVTSILAGFGNALGHALITKGRALYEVCPIQSAEGATVGFVVHGVQNTINLLGLQWQRQPNNQDQAPWPLLRFRRLPRERMVLVRLPRPYRQLPKHLEALRSSGSAVPDFAIDNYNPDGSLRVHYDLEELRAIEHRAVATVTKAIGWPARGSFQEACTGYYYMLRFLRFASFKAEMRGVVTDTINRVLSRSCADTTVRLRGLPTKQIVADNLRRLREGALDFSVAINELSVYR